MADGHQVPVQAMATFVVRNDKNRGLLIESLEATNGNVYFFKWHDQPLQRHCEQMQNFIKAANVQRTRRMLIDVTEFFTEYFRPVDGDRTEVVFRATKLMSTIDQIDKVYTMKLNKELGIAKRMQTIAENKQANIVAKNNKITSKIATAEAKFQIERARRINAAQGNHCGGPAPGGGVGSAPGGGVGSAPGGGVGSAPGVGVPTTGGESSQGGATEVAETQLNYTETPLPNDHSMDSL